MDLGSQQLRWQVLTRGPEGRAGSGASPERRTRSRRAGRAFIVIHGPVAVARGYFCEDGDDVDECGIRRVVSKDREQCRLDCRSVENILKPERDSSASFVAAVWEPS